MILGPPPIHRCNIAFGVSNLNRSEYESQPRVIVQALHPIPKKSRQEPVISVKQSDVLTARLLQTSIEVPSLLSALFVANVTHAWIVIAATDLGSLVRGHIVADHQFVIIEILLKHTLDRFGQVSSRVVGGNANAYFNHWCWCCRIFGGVLKLCWSTRKPFWSAARSARTRRPRRTPNMFVARTEVVVMRL